jgi:ADP-ribosylation factor 2-binding protein
MFISELELRKTELEGEVFEMLFTLTDFLAFKEMFVDYKIMKQSGALDNVLSITTL